MTHAPKNKYLFLFEILWLFIKVFKTKLECQHNYSIQFIQSCQVLKVATAFINSIADTFFLSQRGISFSNLWFDVHFRNIPFHICHFNTSGMPFSPTKRHNLPLLQDTPHYLLYSTENCIILFGCTLPGGPESKIRKLHNISWVHPAGIKDPNKLWTFPRNALVAQPWLILLFLTWACLCKRLFDAL